MKTRPAAANILARYHEDIVDAWLGRLRVVEGSGVGGRPADEARALGRMLFRALLLSVAEDHPDQVRALVQEIGPRLVEAGFRLAESQQAILRVKEVVTPHLANALRGDLDAFLFTSHAIDRFIQMVVCELAEGYPTFVHSHSDAYVKQLEERNRLLEHLVIRDGLTGLYNYRYFQERLREELERARRYARDLTLLLVDVDRFKCVNDTLGHPAGDRALVDVASRIRATIRDTDVPARYGGDEFAVILPEATRDGGQAVGERIRAAVEGFDVAAGERRHRLTLSIGIAAFPSDADDARPLIELSDQALYQAKRSGGNRVAVGSTRPSGGVPTTLDQPRRSRWLRLAG